VIGDMISPFKAVIGDSSYKAVEARLLAAIHLRFGLPPQPAGKLKTIKAADRAAAYLEATRLAGFTEAEARRFFGAPPASTRRSSATISTPWPAETRSALPGAIRALRAAKRGVTGTFPSGALISCPESQMPNDPRLLPRPPASTPSPRPVRAMSSR
jgi:5'-deoxynucleotidase YfbR-like HD superfamily hydrolase